MQELRIGIKSPCNENWEKMTQGEKGKFCSSCSKTVYDVTNLTNEEIAIEYKKNNNSMCIRIPVSRIAVNNVKKNSTSYIKYVITLFITLWIGMKTSFANSKSIYGDSAHIEEDKRQKLEKIQINGKVLDSALNNTPISFASIKILQKDRVIGIGYSNTDGLFSISIYGDSLYLGDNLSMYINMFGYMPVQKDFEIKSKIDSTIYMESGVIQLEGIDIVARLKPQDISIMGGMMMGVMIVPIHNTALGRDQYDTKTYNSEEIQNYNLGRDF